MTVKKVVVALIIIALIIAIFNPFGLRDKITGKSAPATDQDPK